MATPRKGENHEGGTGGAGGAGGGATGPGPHAGTIAGTIAGTTGVAAIGGDIWVKAGGITTGYGPVGTGAGAVCGAEASGTVRQYGPT